MTNNYLIAAYIDGQLRYKVVQDEDAWEHKHEFGDVTKIPNYILHLPSEPNELERKIRRITTEDREWE
ncbi:unnamed protein product [marine sediment metagenome]|uniref:Uncharacterized protein n=1 Tax=marine sediment metagenome TaxID=412755 RepID=X1G7A1_9ZZZZ